MSRVRFPKKTDEGNSMGGKATKVKRRANKGAGRLCVIEGCENQMLARGLCGSHYGKLLRIGCLEVSYHTEREQHGRRGTRLYNIWQLMKSRCENSKNKNYDRYGGRGIKVCDEWRSSSAFMDWAHANGYSDDLTLDRVNNDGNYEPSNCRWATMKEQRRNSGILRQVIRHDGRVYDTIKDAADDNGIHYQTLYKACIGNRGIHGGPAWKLVEA